MPDPPEDFNICPSCGTEFGYTDAGVAFEQVRAKWLSCGAPWFSTYIQPPAQWNPIQQLLDAGLAFRYSVGSTHARTVNHPEITIGGSVSSKQKDFVAA